MDDKINLSREINRISAETGFSQRLIEKDYYLTKILHEISKKDIKNLVFKGGTCLNKCYLGFYRLSEDLDFIINEDLSKLSKTQIKKRLDNIRGEIFQILDKLNLETNKEMGKGWKMLTSKEDPGIIGLEIVTSYNSIIDDSEQTIKLDMSFRKQLLRPSRKMRVRHEFFNALGDPLLEKDVNIEAIDLSENFAEKFRALVTRESIAIRDIYDIYFALKENFLQIDKDLIKTSLNKINETSGYSFAKEDLKLFIENLNSKKHQLNKEELLAVLKSGEDINIEEAINLIIKSFSSAENSKTN